MIGQKRLLSISRFETEILQEKILVYVQGAFRDYSKCLRFFWFKNISENQAASFEEIYSRQKFFLESGLLKFQLFVSYFSDIIS